MGAGESHVAEFKSDFSVSYKDDSFTDSATGVRAVSLLADPIQIYVIGNKTEAKSTMIQQFLGVDYNHLWDQGNGRVCYFTSVPVEGDGTSMSAMIWDLDTTVVTDMKLSGALFPHSICIMAVYDTNDRKSFDTIIDHLKQCPWQLDGTPVLVVGCQEGDLHQSHVTFSEATEMAATFGIRAMEVDTKTSQNIHGAFTYLAVKCNKNHFSQ